MNQAYKYELKPNNKQIALLSKHCGVARFAWNWALARRKSEYETTGKSSNAIEQHRQLNALKKIEFPWMYDVSKCAPQEALRNLDKAFVNFRSGHKNGNCIGFPKFKKKGVRDSFRLTGFMHIYGNDIQLPRLGRIRTKENTAKFKGRVLSATVSREADRWFVSLAVEREREIPVRIDSEIVGIDLGLNSFAVIYDGNNTEHIYSPKPLKERLKRLQHLSRRHSRKQKGSNNRRKSTLRLVRLHRKIGNIRKDFLAKLTTSLAKTKSAIIIEDLNVKGMSSKKRHLARSIADVSWGEFRRMLEYKTQWYGSRLVVIGRFEPTSKMCSECGRINESLELSDRTWICMYCGAYHERDENSSKNVRQRGIEILNTESSSGINACGVAGRPVAKQAGNGEAGSKHIDYALGYNK